MNSIRIFASKALLFFRKHFVLRPRGVILGSGVFATRNCRFEGNNKIDRLTSLLSTHVGYGTYIRESCRFLNTKIGRFCSIGSEVTCVIGKHPTRDFVSTHPAFFSLRNQAGFTYARQQRFEEFEPTKEGGFSIIIGNDVWIGEGATLMDGVEIGDGAVVAAKALVTKNVPPYTIVGGIPAKSIKTRFSEEDVQWLLEFKWWDKSPKWIRKNYEYFSDIAAFKSHIEQYSS